MSDKDKNMAGLKEELEKQLKKLTSMTGVRMTIEAETEEELAQAIDQVKNLTGAYREKYDKNHFLKSLILGEQDLYGEKLTEHARRFGIYTEEGKRLFLVQAKRKDKEAVLEVLKGLYPTRTKVQIVTLPGELLAILMDAGKDDEDETMASYAHEIADTLSAEAMAAVRIGYSAYVPALPELGEEYRKIRLALEVGRLFYPHQKVFFSGHLGIGGLLYQLPQEVCAAYLKEVFGDDDSWMDPELVDCVEQFLQNNLNISVTSRKLYMHRNTLTYRIEQVLKKTGLDLRIFEDAMVFKVAMMLLNFKGDRENA